MLLFSLLYVFSHWGILIALLCYGMVALFLFIFLKKKHKRKRKMSCTMNEQNNTRDVKQTPKMYIKKIRLLKSPLPWPFSKKKKDKPNRFRCWQKMGLKHPLHCCELCIYLLTKGYTIITLVPSQMLKFM